MPAFHYPICSCNESDILVFQFLKLLEYQIALFRQAGLCLLTNTRHAQHDDSIVAARA